MIGWIAGAVVAGAAVLGTIGAAWKIDWLGPIPKDKRRFVTGREPRIHAAHGTRVWWECRGGGHPLVVTVPGVPELERAIARWPFYEGGVEPPRTRAGFKWKGWGPSSAVEQVRALLEEIIPYTTWVTLSFSPEEVRLTLRGWKHGDPGAVLDKFAHVAAALGTGIERATAGIDLDGEGAPSGAPVALPSD
jgi:hypothetical protein